MLNQDVLKEFIFNCKMRKLSERTIKSYRNNNLELFRFIEEEYDVVELEETNHLHIKGNILFHDFLLLFYIEIRQFSVVSRTFDIKLY